MSGKYIINLDTVGSTNDYAREYLKSCDRGYEMVVVSATEQTKGKGQQGKTWESTRGENITCSIVVRPRNLAIDKQFLVSMTVSLAICRFLEKHECKASIKWPNDIYVGDKKICGILIENILMGSEFKYAIIGVGLNINQLEFSQWIPNPTSLALETRKRFDVADLLNDLLFQIEYSLQKLSVSHFSEIKSLYLDCLYGRNQVRMFKSEGSTWQGTIVDVDDYGFLEIKKGEVSSFFSFKEVEYVLPTR